MAFWYTVYPVTASYAVMIAADFPSAQSGVFSIRNTVPGATTVTLPGINGPWTITDGAGVASANPITVACPAGFTINGAPTYILSFDWQTVAFTLDPTDSNYITGL